MPNVDDQNQDGELREAAARLDEHLVLSVAYEPPQAFASDICGLDDTALRRVVTLTLARAGVAQPVELSLLATDDDGLRTLNREYRGKDEATDVLSFPLLDAPLVEAPDEQLWQLPENPDDLASYTSLDPTNTAAESDLAEDAEVEEAASDGAGDEDEEEVAFLVPEEMHLHLGDIALSRDAIARQAAQAGHSAAWECAYLIAHGVLHLVGYDDQTDTGYHAMVAHQEAVLALANIAK